MSHVGAMDSIKAHYNRLLRPITREFGAFAPATITSIVGFSAGGPVSLLRVTGRWVYVTCELSFYSEQKASTEGIQFELLSRQIQDESTVISTLTALGNLSMNAQLGDGHTVDVSGAVAASRPAIIKLRLYSKLGFLRPRYGVYEVLSQ